MGSLLGAAVALVVKVVVVFTVVTGVVFIVAPENAGHVRDRAISAVAFAITGVVDLVQASASAAEQAL